MKFVKGCALVNKYDDLHYESLGEGISVCVSSEHRFGTDAFLLADFASPRHKDKVADLCTGNGIVALLMSRDHKPSEIFAVELQEKAYDQLCLSVSKSGCDEIRPVHADLKEWQAPYQLDVITCNPPYKIDNTGAKNDSGAVSIARHEIACTMLDVCKTAKRSLKFGGRLCICNRPERLADVIDAMRQCGIEPKRLRCVHKDENTEPWLILVEGRLGGSKFLKIEKPLLVKGRNGEAYSDEMKRIYKLI